MPLRRRGAVLLYRGGRCPSRSGSHRLPHAGSPLRAGTCRIRRNGESLAPRAGRTAARDLLTEHVFVTSRASDHEHVFVSRGGPDLMRRASHRGVTSQGPWGQRRTGVCLRHLEEVSSYRTPVRRWPGDRRRQADLKGRGERGRDTERQAPGDTRLHKRVPRQSGATRRRSARSARRSGSPPPRPSTPTSPCSSGRAT